MREAVKCYGAGAYRAAVVLAMAASMDELRRKVNNLASSGGASKQLKQLSDSVISAHKDQEPFEKKLIDGCKKLDIISPAEHTKLELLLKTRNLCAHPSGHTGTAEEARDVITSLIDIILAQPPQLGISGVESLLKRIAGPAFLPKTLLEDAKLTAKHEMQSIHPKAYLPLVRRIIKCLLDTSCVDPARQNCKLFLTALCTLNADLQATVWDNAAPMAESADCTEEALFLYSQDPGGLSIAGDLHRIRVIAHIRNNFENPLALQTINSWVELELLSAEEKEELITLLNPKITAVDPPTLGLICANSTWDDLRSAGFSELIRRVSSSTFNRSRDAISTAIALSVEATERMTDSEAYRLLLGIASAAKSGTFKAQDVCRDGIGSHGGVLDKFERHVNSNWENFIRSKTNARYLVDLLGNSKRLDLSREVASRIAETDLAKLGGTERERLFEMTRDMLESTVDFPREKPAEFLKNLRGMVDDF